MYILISLTLIAILCVLYSHLIYDEYITASYTILIAVLIVGWLIVGNFYPIKSKSKIIKIENFKNYKVRKLNNSIILEDKKMIDYQIKLNDSIKDLDTSKLKIISIEEYNLYDSKIDTILNILKKNKYEIRFK